MKPAIRLAAIMRLPVIYIGTHDSIGLGEDGPTHQPVEHLAMLRAIPHLVVLRPADATETVEAWRVAMARTEGPTLLVLTRQKLPVLDRAKLGAGGGVARGAYVLLDPPGGHPQAILIATGSEVHVALAAARLLQADRVRVRVVSMPSWELFAEQPEEYRGEVLPPTVARATRHRGCVPVRVGALDHRRGRHARHDGLRRVRPGRPPVRGVQVHPRARRRHGAAAARAAAPPRPARGRLMMAQRQSPAANPLVRLGELGQSPWYDYITRDLVTTGELGRLIAEDGLRGMTSNPTIFEKAIAGSRLYDAEIRAQTDAGRSAQEIFEHLAVADVRAACDVVRPVYERPPAATAWSRWRCRPTLANDTEATIHEAERLWHALDRPNAMIKIPGTRRRPPGDHPLHRCRDQRQRHPAFSVERYGEVIDAFMAGLEAPSRRATRSRGDHLGRELLREPGRRQGGPAARRPGRPPGRRGRIAIANAAAAYDRSSGPSTRRGGTARRRAAPGRSGRSGPPPAPRIRATPTCTTSRRWWPRGR